MTIRVEDVLKKALKKISKPENWTKNAAARDAKGVFVLVEDDSAVCWCSLGAVWSATKNEQAHLTAERVLEDVIGGDIAEFNDDSDRQHEDVVSVFKKAIRRARNRRLKMAAKRARK